MSCTTLCLNLGVKIPAPCKLHLHYLCSSQCFCLHIGIPMFHYGTFELCSSLIISPHCYCNVVLHIFLCISCIPNCKFYILYSDQRWAKKCLIMNKAFNCKIVKCLQPVITPPRVIWPLILP